jgi:hypothetical protein
MAHALAVEVASGTGVGAATVGATLAMESGVTAGDVFGDSDGALDALGTVVVPAVGPAHAAVTVKRMPSRMVNLGSRIFQPATAGSIRVYQPCASGSGVP